jgi:TP901 family phage tail tape measure protein
MAEFIEGKAKVTLDGEDAGIQLEKLEKQAVDLRKALVQLKSEELLDNKKIKDTEAKLRAVNKEMKLVKDQTTTYAATLKNLSGASIKELEAAKRKLSYEVRQLSRNTDEYKRKAGDLSRVKAEIAKVTREMNAAGVQAQSFGQKLSNATSSGFLFATGGLLAGFTALTGLARGAFNTMNEFSKKVSELQAITGAAGEDLEFLSQRARQLGAQYGYAASDIVEAMKMVGSAKPELLSNVQALGQMTEAVLTLAQASGMDLASTTANLTTIMNQFGMSADEANKSINILAAGSKFGAVEVDYLAASISKVGSIAKAAGLSLEATTAVMELFGEKGVAAETAGTGFKKVLTELQKDTRNYTNGVFDLNKAIDNNQNIAGDNLALQKKFGSEFFGLAQILFQNKERFRELNEQVTGTNTAFEQAAIATDNLKGDLDKAKGSWDAMVLSIEEGNGVISKAFRGVVKGGSALLNLFTELNTTYDTNAEKVQNLNKAAEKALPFWDKYIKTIGFFNPKFKKDLQDFLDVNVDGIKTTATSGTLGVLDKLGKKVEELKKKSETEETDKSKPVSDKEKKDLERKNKAIEDETKKLIETIEQLNLALVEDAQEKALKEVEIWRKKENEKINESTASGALKTEALALIEENYNKKVDEIYDKYAQIERKKKADEEELERKRNEEKLKLEQEQAEKIQKLREQYGLVTDAEFLQIELDTLEEHYNNKLLTEEQYLQAKDLLIQKYRDKEIKDNELAEQRKLEQLFNRLNRVQSALNLSAGFISTLKEKELVEAGENEEKRKKITKKYANYEFALRAAQIIADTAANSVKAFGALVGIPIVGPKLAAIAAIAASTFGMAQLALANAERVKVQGLAKGGKFGVTRAQDNRTFSAQYGGNGSGYYSQPTVLVAEEGPEFVVSNKSLRNPAIRSIVDRIDSYQRGSYSAPNYDRIFKSMSVKGFADGGFISQVQPMQQAQNDNVAAMMLVGEFRNFKDEISTWQRNLKTFVTTMDINERANELELLRTEVRI